ncbi:sce7725 family protein [Loigolactobacillus binensis]|uniref:Sce7725 family protein n=1 Tax=Loigolactobacillus binensis TaxID=2559922 RepID=A0ABW3EE27_9LACO|nr:sce7725 family protein [Loigolactobacillus binensis]
MRIYYPYLRGKQFELQALLALQKADKLSLAVIPIIEPVRDSHYLADCVATFITAGRPLIIISNPQVGTYQQHRQQRYPLTQWQASPYFKHALLVTKATSLADYLAADVLLFTHPDVLTVFPEPQSQQLVIVGPSHRLRRQLNYQVTLTDPTPQGWDGADYLLQPQTFFSDQPWFATATGFSDFVTVGAGYSDKGYPVPFIKLTLTVPRSRQLWLHHFISTDFSDFKQPKAKYFSAGTQLVAWLKLHPEVPLTLGLAALQTSIQQAHFPGLGKVKQWLLMHHLELVAQILNVNNHEC